MVSVADQGELIRFCAEDVGVYVTAVLLIPLVIQNHGAGMLGVSILIRIQPQLRQIADHLSVVNSVQRDIVQADISFFVNR